MLYIGNIATEVCMCKAYALLAYYFKNPTDCRWMQRLIQRERELRMVKLLVAKYRLYILNATCSR